MLQDALWTTLYSDEEIRMIEEHDKLDQEVQNEIQALVDMCLDI